MCQNVVCSLLVLDVQEPDNSGGHQNLSTVTVMGSSSSAEPLGAPILVTGMVFHVRSDSSVTSAMHLLSDNDLLVFLHLNFARLILSNSFLGCCFLFILVHSSFVVSVQKVFGSLDLHQSIRSLTTDQFSEALLIIIFDQMLLHSLF